MLAQAMYQPRLGQFCSYDSDANGNSLGGGQGDTGTTGGSGGYGGGPDISASSDTAGVVDDGLFDVDPGTAPINSVALETQPGPSFSSVAHAIGQSMQVGGWAAGMSGASVVGSVISASPDIATATQQSFGFMAEHADIMAGPMATESTTSASTNSNSGNVGFGGGGDPNIGFWVPPANWGNSQPDWQGG